MQCICNFQQIFRDFENLRLRMQDPKKKSRLNHIHPERITNHGCACGKTHSEMRGEKKLVQIGTRRYPSPSLVKIKIPLNKNKNNSHEVQLFPVQTRKINANYRNDLNETNRSVPSAPERCANKEILNRAKKDPFIDYSTSCVNAALCPNVVRNSFVCS